MIGRTSQFKRRMKALKALREHSELLGMVVDRRLRLQESQDHLDDQDVQFKEMDRWKQDALREILATVPIFLLQGPPGVGKTYVVGDLVRRRLKDDATSRMLLSAQSNSAIDHLMDEVRGAFGKEPLMIRARSADDDSQDDGVGLDEQAAKLLTSLASSPLAVSAPGALKARLSRLTAAARPGAEAGTQKQRTNAEMRAFHSMILRAANLVFATTNSSAVERLIDEGSLFDWSIVEEAGKATGGELVSPLLLSNRRLMIGDHKQLPPYGIEKIIPLLGKTKDVKEALALCEESISRHLKDEAIDELFDEVGGRHEALARSVGRRSDCSRCLRFRRAGVQSAEEGKEGHADRTASHGAAQDAPGDCQDRLRLLLRRRTDDQPKEGDALSVQEADRGSVVGCSRVQADYVHRPALRPQSAAMRLRRPTAAMEQPEGS